MPISPRTSSGVEQSTLLQALDESFQTERERLDVPGAAMAVVQNGSVLYEQGVGVESIETRRPVTADMLFRIGSTTKMFTALGLAILMDQGCVDLEAPIGEYVDGLNPALAKLTGARLLSHTAGLKDDGNEYGPHDPAALAATARSWTGGSHLLPIPDRVFSYSNPGYTLAGLLLQEVARCGRYAGAIQKLILTPLGMTHTTFAPTMAMTFPLAQGHTPQDDGALGVVRPYSDHAGYWPGGFLMSNVSDLARFAIALMDRGAVNDDPILPGAAVDAITSPRIQVKKGMSYGYGLFLHTQHGVEVMEHGGGILGYTSLLRMVPAYRFAVVILANRDGAMLTQAADRAMELLLPMDPSDSPEDETVALDEEILRTHAGSYAQTPEEILEVVVNEGRLLLHMGDLHMPLRPVAERQFKVAVPELSEELDVEFRCGEDGAAAYMTLGYRVYLKQ